MDALGRIDCPVLVLAADQDYTPVAFKQAYTAMIRGATLVIIDDSRHLLPIERPEAFNAALLAFLSSGSASFSEAQDAATASRRP